MLRIEFKKENTMQDDNKTGKIIVHVDIDLEDLVPEFIENRYDDIKEISKLLEAEEYEKIQFLAHTMKGSGGGYGFDEVTNIGMRMENAAKQRNREIIMEQLRVLSEYLDNVEVIYE